MASKKYSFLTGFLCLLASIGFSQMGSSYDVKDSSVVPSKRMPQHTEFLNGTYNFPAKPRNQWEVGVKVGAFTVSGDVPAVFPTPGLGLHVRKAFGYVFSMRLEYMYGIGKGLSWKPNENFAKNPAWVNNGYSAPVRGGDGVISSVQGAFGYPSNEPLQAVYYNYLTHTQDLSLQGVFTLNNIRFHKSKTGINLYGFGGIGGSIYRTYVNALGSD